ncbi:hypothetical protein F3X89_03865 [Rhizobium rhizogenes]|uniref:hypothetical protein n=1 Tax=Rhizobium rhizogenes TaxID=359 RepID=UPI00193CC76F|nr:hypothetical protein [Rhizobium rhizogenes]QRM36971.1 hypothetical protein F3X89_03865 [Rhizobium rhizogenes]
MNYSTPCGDITSRYRKLQQELAEIRPSAYLARRSGVEEMIALLVEAHLWRMRLIELTFASIIFFWLGFAIAVRCP